MDAQDVTLAYEILLGRAPESMSTIRSHLQAPDLAALGRRLIESPEFRAKHGLAESVPGLHVYSGYVPADLSVIAEFMSAPAKPEPGFIVDFLGVRTRTSYAPAFVQFEGRVLGPPIPADFHSETGEWLGLLKSVRGAEGQYRAMELGAGWGPWLVAGALAAAKRGITDIRLYGVEADAGRAAFLEQHFRDNGLDPAAHHVLRGAAGTKAGIVQWPASDDPAADYGTRPVGPGAKDYFGRSVARVVDVTVFGINDLLRNEERWDMLHIDVQGSEVELCEAGLDEISARVSWLIVGTHSRLLEGQLLQLFRQNAWILEHEKPARFIFNSEMNSLEAMTVLDGIQVWRNPRFP